MIEAIIFDWFGVCTKENWADCLARELQNKLKIDEKTIRAEFKPLIQPFARAEISSKQFLDKFIGALDKNRNPGDFEYLFTKIPDINFELLDFVLKLKKNYRTYLLSNNFGPIFPLYDKQLDFNQYFDKLFLSHELRLSKTQNEIWDVVLSQITQAPHELLFIDNKKNILSIHLGWESK